MDKDFERLWWLFLLEAFLIFIVTVNGGFQFIKDNTSNSILIILGLLTFVSIFYGFIFSEGKKIQENFKNSINFFKDVEWNNLNDCVENKDTEQISEKTREIERIEGFSSNINPIKWLFLATFFLIVSLACLMSKLIIPVINILISDIGVVLFFLGLLFVMFLMNSLLVLAINEQKIDRDRKQAMDKLWKEFLETRVINNRNKSSVYKKRK